jgi:hypothetical protein
MKRIITLLIAIVLCSSAVNAQGFFFGGGPDLEVIGGPSFGFHIQFGSDHVGSKYFGIRGDASLIFTPGLDLGLGLDLFGRVPLEGITPYFGGGAKAYVLGGIVFNLHGLAGLEFAVSRGLGVYLEAQPGVLIAPNGSAFQFGLLLGLRGHF